MKIFEFKFKLPISEQNTAFIPIVGKTMGYVEGSEMTPEECIVNFFDNLVGQINARVETGITAHCGEVAKEVGEAVKGQYYDNVEITNGFTEINGTGE